MKFLKSVGGELGLVFLLVALVPILTAYFVANSIFSQAMQREKREALTAVADAAHARIESYVLGLVTDTTTLAQLPELVSVLKGERTVLPIALDAYLRGYREKKGYHDLLLVDQAGRIRLSLSGRELEGHNIHDEQLRATQLARTIDAANTLLQTEVSNFAPYPPSMAYAAFLAAPVFDGGVIIGNVVLQIDPSEVNGIVNRFGGLGESGELLAGSLDGDRLVITAPPRHQPELVNQAVDKSRFTPLLGALSGQQGTGWMEDYRGQRTLAVWRYLPSLNWGLLVKIDEDELKLPVRRFEFISLWVMLGSVLLVLAGVLLTNRLVSRPIVRFAQKVKALKEESLPPAVEVDARHEIAELVAAFNTLIASVRTHQQKLEERVQQRTEDLAEANAGLERANQELLDSNNELALTLAELKRTHTQLVESEKMATLGQLIAGIAHEINTPLGSIASSIETIAQAYRHQGEFLQIYAELPEEVRVLVRRLLEHAVKGSTLSLKEKRNLKRSYEQALAEYPALDSRKAADIFSQLPPLELRDFMALLTYAPADALLEQVKRGINIHRASQNIRIAAEKARKVVFALKNFSRYGDAGEQTPTSLRESIETVLTLYQNQMKQSVELRTDLPEIAPVPAYADELGQVWMNLIHNALQAMDYSGVLEISLEQGAEHAIVRIRDSGCGIPEDIQERIFQPFFTTKPAGEGSGLGLDIVRKIIEKHGGSIRFESQAGVGTSFEVRLPLKGRP